MAFDEFNGKVAVNEAFCLALRGLSVVAYKIVPGTAASFRHCARRPAAENLKSAMCQQLQLFLSAGVQHLVPFFEVCSSFFYLHNNCVDFNLDSDKWLVELRVVGGVMFWNGADDLGFWSDVFFNLDSDKWLIERAVVGVMMLWRDDLAVWSDVGRTHEGFHHDFDFVF